MCGKPGKGRHGTSHHAKVMRFTAHLLPVYLIVRIFIFTIMKIFVTDISASTGRTDFIFDIWLWHGDLCRISPTWKIGVTLGTKCCTLRRAKNTPIRSFVSNLYISQHSVTKVCITVNTKNSKSHCKQEVDVR
jgi:hypothetical protein